MKLHALALAGLLLSASPPAVTATGADGVAIDAYDRSVATHRAGGVMLGVGSAVFVGTVVAVGAVPCPTVERCHGTLGLGLAGLAFATTGPVLASLGAHNNGRVLRLGGLEVGRLPGLGGLVLSGVGLAAGVTTVVAVLRVPGPLAGAAGATWVLGSLAGYALAVVQRAMARRAYEPPTAAAPTRWRPTVGFAAGTAFVGVEASL